ncbi:regucalcin [Pluteus cervinus]|uniref:Regucalcin n=1 Tax=Pluteus cervinus TaxID=181527 RepID=A0ACD3BIT3_9AGAR|nr:regucalcin [Pluteus cervinus]
MPKVKEFIIESPWVRTGCTLGEGPIYDPDTSTLHFVDISEKKVFHLDTETLRLDVEQFDEPVSCLALRRNSEGLACAAAQGFGILGGDSSLSYLNKPLSPADAPHTRFNDGACDSQGRFFAGTVFSEQHGVTGKLYCYDPALGTCEVVDPGPFTDSNGLGWSPDEKTFYFTDSLVNKIYAYDYEDGQLSNRRVVIDAVELGFPSQTFCDGLCIDSEGFIWSARWGGSRIVRFATDGTVDAQIVFPTALNITSCCFGGPENDKLFVTTAHCGALGGDATRQEQYPDSGHLFLVDFLGQFRGGDRHRFSG